MREIKFRAWDKTRNEYVTDALRFELRCLEYPDRRKNKPNNTHIGFDQFVNQWFDMEQYTGLKDKNGVEIYEGDVFIDRTDDRYYCVGFSEGCFDGRQLNKLEYSGDELFIFDMDECEVIGNIHENPELI